MAILKCKMCGGDLELEEGSYVAECEFCGSKQTVPKADDEKKLNLFGRANKLRSVCEFDKAYGVYESIVAEFSDEAEAYWGLVLCKYGIEYVDDPKTGNKIPTCHRSSFESVLDDVNYKTAIEKADVVAKELYRSEAEAIETIRKGIIEISSKEEPYDIFICYKETDKNGERTKDSVLAQEIYDELTEKDYKVFFSRITLEDKLGVKYEPYIFSALHSSKIMLVIGTKAEHLDAIWVKNEWSRYLKLIASGEKKTIIPCYRNMDPYDLPAEFSDLQGQDMGKVGAIQDLVRGIGKIIPRKKPTEQGGTATQGGGAMPMGGIDQNALVKRANGFLLSGDIAKASEYYEKVLDMDPENQGALVGTILIELRLNDTKSLEDGLKFFHNTKAYKSIKGVSSDTSYFDGLLEKIKENNYKAIENCFASGRYSEVDGHIKNLLTYEKPNERLALYSFLAKNNAKTIEELIPRKDAIHELNGYSDLLKNVGADIKKELENAVAKQRANDYEALETAFSAGEYEKIEDLAVKALRFGNDEKPYLLAFLAYYKVDSIDVLDATNFHFLKEEPFELLKENGTKETLDKLSYMATKQKERIAIEVKEAFEEKDFDKAQEKCKLYKEFDLKNEEINLIHLFAELNISTYEEIKTLEAEFTRSETYKTLISSCSKEIKKQLEEWIEKQTNYKNNERKQKIEALENEIQEALEKSDFEKAKSLARECLKLDSKNEKAHLTIYLASKKVRVIEDLVKQKRDFTKENEYKSLVPFLSNETKKRFENVIAKIKANKKKAIIITVSVILAVLLIIGIVLLVYFNSDSYIYGAKNDGNGGMIITDYRGNETEVVIPSEIDGKPVTAIGNSAFWYCSSIESIVIPNSVTTIGYGAFSYCSSLKSIVIPNSVITIGEHAFQSCLSLTSIVIPNSVTTIGNSAFNDCNSLTSVVIPNSVTTIGSSAFFGCYSLTIYCEAESQPSGWSSYWNSGYRPVVWGYTGAGITEDGFKWMETTKGVVITGYTGNGSDVVIPSEINGKAITSIEDRAFYQCSNLESVVIPNSVTTIGEYAFSDCSSLKSIEIPNSVTTIGVWAFSGCSSLKSIEIPNGVTTIGSSAFSFCSSLTSVVIPNSVTTIGNDAFYNCSSLESIVIPNSVTTIEHYAFSGCSSLKSIVIPDGVTTIEHHAFSNCESLTIYCEAESQPIGWGDDWNNSSRPVEWGYTSGEKGTTADGFVWKEKGEGIFITGYTGEETNVVIPSTIEGKSVIGISARAFYDLDSIKTVTIYEKIVTIGEYAFLECDNIQTIYYEAKSVPSGWNANWNIKSIYSSGQHSTLEGFCKQHTFGEPVTIEKPTCYKDGLSSRQCTVCGYSETETILAMHGSDETIKGYEATCTENGLTDGLKCSACGYVFVAQEVIPAKGHSEETVKGYDATCTASGLTDGIKCTTCGDTVKAQETISAYGHNSLTELKEVEPTCTEGGLTSGRACSRCGHVTKAQEALEPLGHTPITDYGTAPTCTKTGLTDGEHCTRCKAVLIEQEVIPVIDHSYSLDGTCSGCGKSRDDEEY